MKLYIKDGNIYWQDETFIAADAVYDLNSFQEELLRNGGTADFVDGTIVITPKAPEIAEAPTPNIITKRAFLARITPDEYATIKGAATQNATLDYFWSMFMVSEEIDLAYPDTVNGLNMMENAGLIAAGRAAEILS